MIVIAAQTAAKTTDRINISAKMLPCSFVATGLGVGESIALQVTADNGASWEALNLETAITLSSTGNVKGIYVPLVLRLVKGITAGNAGVAMYFNEDGTGVSL